MRALLAAILLLALPGVAATPATPVWEFDGSTVEGSGAVGEPVAVTVRVKAHADASATILFRAPDWVHVDGGPWELAARAGATAERTWTLTPTREGFWAAVAHTDPPGSGASCACALGFASGAPEAIVGTSADAAVPVPVLDRALTAAPQEGGEVRLEQAVIPVSSWLAFAEIHAWATPGSTYHCDVCATRVPDPEDEARGPGNDTLLLAASFPLAEGEAYTLRDEVIVRFETPEGSPVEPTATVPAGCENRRWGTDEVWACDTPSEEWAHVAGSDGARARVPAGALPALAALALAGLAYRPPRGNRR